MIMDRDRSIQEIELRSVKAAELVSTVQPEKLLLELQREDAKFEALKANLEGNESIMERITDELKALRRKLDFFKGVEEIITLTEEVKKELIEIKKVESSIHIKADKMETFYTELRKKYTQAEAFQDSFEELKAKAEQHTNDLESLKSKVPDFVKREELEGFMEKVQKNVEALKEVSRTSSLTKDITKLKGLLNNIK